MSNDQAHTSIRNYAITFAKRAYRSALAQFYLANKWANYHLLLGLFSTIFSVFAGTSLLSGNNLFETSAGFLALAASALIAISTFLNPNKRSQEHYNAATSYLVISNNARFLYEVESIMNNMTNDQLLTKMSELTKKSDELSKNSPRIPPKEWDKAKKALQKHFTIARKEGIDELQEE